MVPTKKNLAGGGVGGGEAGREGLGLKVDRVVTSEASPLPHEQGRFADSIPAAQLCRYQA